MDPDVYRRQIEHIKVLITTAERALWQALRDLEELEARESDTQSSIGGSHPTVGSALSGSPSSDDASAVQCQCDWTIAFGTIQRVSEDCRVHYWKARQMGPFKGPGDADDLT